MLATSHHASQQPSQHSSPPHNFLPIIPSPLSPRRINGSFDPRPYNPSFMMSSPSQPQSNQQSQNPKPSYSSRPIKQVPATIHRSDALRERRRDMFLRKVRQGRDDSKWDTRIDDMARLDYVNQMRRWEAEQARSAPTTSSSDLAEAENENDVQGYGTRISGMDTQAQFAAPLDLEADEVLRRESEEIEALLSLMESSELEGGGGGGGGIGDGGIGDGAVEAQDDASSFGSDDEEYDSIFMDLIDESGGDSEEVQQQLAVEDEMDLS